MKLVAIILFVFILSTPLCRSYGQSDTSGAEQQEGEKKRYLYIWKDDRGNVHASNDLGRVPERYRGRIERIPEPAESMEQPTIIIEPHTIQLEPEHMPNEQAQKAVWQGRMREAKDRLKKAEERYKDLQIEREGLFRQWGSPAYAPLDVRERAVQIEEELAEAREEINNARHDLDVVIPEDARKAGIPPGWLRE